MNAPPTRMTASVSAPFPARAPATRLRQWKGRTIKTRNPPQIAALRGVGPNRGSDSVTQGMVQWFDSEKASIHRPGRRPLPTSFVPRADVPAGGAEASTSRAGHCRGRRSVSMS